MNDAENAAWSSGGGGNRSGFSLVELLVVIAVISALGAAAASLVGAGGRTAEINRSLIVLSGFLEQARQVALAENTYGYVGFGEDESGELQVVVFSSLSGTDVARYPGGSSQIDPDDVRLRSRVTGLPGVALGESLPSGNALRESGSRLPSAQTNSPQSGDLPGFTATSGVVFDRLIKFTPAGVAVLREVPDEMIQFVVLAERADGGSPADAALASVVRVSGLTGRVAIYQP